VVDEQGVTPLFDVKNEFCEESFDFVSSSPWRSAKVGQNKYFFNLICVFALLIFSSGGRA